MGPDRNRTSRFGYCLGEIDRQVHLTSVRKDSCVAPLSFLTALPKYRDDQKELIRQIRRHSFLVEPFKELISGGKVLDIAAHDGRWSYAFAEAGASSVLGIEARPELVESFDQFPNSPAKNRVKLVVEDLYDGLDRLTSEKQEFDVVALFGIMYHVMDHFRIFRKCLELRPKIIIIDSEFMKGNNPFIQLIKEKTDLELNAAPQIESQEVAIKGVLSSVAMERIAEALNCDISWLPWEDLAEVRRTGVGDYFRGNQKRMIRRTCVLYPKAGIGGITVVSQA